MYISESKESANSRQNSANIREYFFTYKKLFKSHKTCSFKCKVSNHTEVNCQFNGFIASKFTTAHLSDCDLHGNEDVSCTIQHTNALNDQKRNCKPHLYFFFSAFGNAPRKLTNLKFPICNTTVIEQSESVPTVPSYLTRHHFGDQYFHCYWQPNS